MTECIGVSLLFRSLMHARTPPMIIGSVFSTGVDEIGGEKCQLQVLMRVWLLAPRV